MSSDAHLPNDVGVGFETERAVDETGSGARARQIDENALGIGDVLVMK